MAAKKKSKLTKVEQLELLAEEVNTALKSEGKVYMGRHHEEIVRIPTGVLAFDMLTGGGLPRCQYTEIFGPESSGKTTLTLQAVAQCQRDGGICAWVVGEEFDDDWAERQGVDLDALVKIEALTGDLMLEAAATYLESGLIDILVIDSVQALGTKRENDGGIESEAYAGAGAPQMWARMYRRSRSLFNSRVTKTAIVGISQAREPIGVFSPGGKPEVIPTGIRVIKHWKAISILCKKGEPTFKDPKSEKKRIIAREFLLKCMKNKTAPRESRAASYTYNFTKAAWGIDRVDEIVRLAKVYDLIEQRGKVLEGYGVKVSGSKDDPAIDQFKEKLRHPKRAVVLTEMTTDILAAMEEDDA